MTESKGTRRLRASLIGLFAFMMIAGGINHAVNPAFYEPLIPAPIPSGPANVASLVVELAIGVLLLIPRTRRWGALLFAGLMVAFFPLHLWDALKETPFVGSTGAAIVRLVIQVALIAGGLWLFRTAPADADSPDPQSPR